MKILVLGDTHGEINAFQHALAVCNREQITTLVQVGDFGYGWEHTASHKAKVPFQRAVDRLAHRAGVDVYWLDGNHENHDQLAKEVDIEATSPQLMWPEDGCGMLWYLPRGSTWTWDGLRFMALGGAYSIDKQYRREGYSWWPQEMITDKDVGKALDVGRVDVMFTHDAPDGVCPIINTDYKGDEFSAANRRCIDAVVANAQPKLLIHGHYHHRYSARRGSLQVEGLGRDGQRQDSWLIINTEDWNG